jgi:hypothetical protein
MTRSFLALGGLVNDQYGLAAQMTGFINQLRAAGTNWQGTWQQIVTANSLVGLPGLGLNVAAGSGVLANDANANNGPLTATLTGGPGNGHAATVSLGGQPAP